ncbi:AN1-type zinc finger protein 2A isoform X2 [Heterodontus francisci]|uniref:AN1-type zinc finger protein 2A isoform X2 n=1 Tax=Heterodontus francisci TaxID=7792 RepID=UPI00355B27C5
MEFPDLGNHCSENSCKRLDFLPMKCDACSQIFCKDHISYAQHRCTSSYKKDIQVPVCPLCNTPVPVRRGEMPDIRVGEHIDRECKSDPAQKKRKIFTNKCSKTGCKQKEMIKVTCDQCHLNFCLKHRHSLDHDCKVDGQHLSKAGNATIVRAQGTSKPSATPSTSKGTSSSRPSGLNTSAHQHYNRVKSKLCRELWRDLWLNLPEMQLPVRSRKTWPWLRLLLQARKNSVDNGSRHSNEVPGLYLVNYPDPGILNLALPCSRFLNQCPWHLRLDHSFWAGKKIELLV